MSSRYTARDAGAATIEFIFLGILLMVPLIYVIVAVSEVQRNNFAVTQAVREAGRAYATSSDPALGIERAQHAMRIALEDQGLTAGEAILRFVEKNASCAEGPVAPDPGAASLDPGTEFQACVVRTFRMPGVPTFFDAANNDVTGRYLVHIDDYRNVT